MSGDDCVIEAKAARRQGRLTDAMALYGEAAESFQAEGQPGRWAHALRHAAELAVRVGESKAGLHDAHTVVEFYRSSPPSDLEMANALRVAALAESVAGEGASALEHWNEARALYMDAGVAQGVLEAERHAAALSCRAA